MVSSSWVRTSLVASMGVITDDPDYLAQYAYSLRVMASAADRVCKPGFADRQRAKSYHLRTLAR